MDTNRFDRLTVTVGQLTSRRALLRALAGAALARGRGGQAGAQAAAADRCLREGKGCGRDRQCCSGLCRRRRCRRSPGQGTCTVEKDTCRAERLFRCNGSPNCTCYVTTRGTSVCGRNGVCASCESNDDCAPIAEAGSVCVRAASVDLCCGSTDGRACVRVCD